jgi:hypothetical protein
MTPGNSIKTSPIKTMKQYCLECPYFELGEERCVELRCYLIERRPRDVGSIVKGRKPKQSVDPSP